MKSEKILCDLPSPQSDINPYPLSNITKPQVIPQTISTLKPKRAPNLSTYVLIVSYIYSC